MDTVFDYVIRIQAVDDPPEVTTDDPSGSFVEGRVDSIPLTSAPSSPPATSAPSTALGTGSPLGANATITPSGGPVTSVPSSARVTVALTDQGSGMYLVTATDRRGSSKRPEQLP